MKRFILFLSALLCFGGAYAQSSYGNERKQADSTQEEGEYDDFVITEEFAININSLNLDEYGAFHEGMAWVKKDGEWGVIDKSGNVVVPIKLQLVEDFEGPRDFKDFQDGFAWFSRKDGKYGFVGNNGTIVVPMYDDFFVSQEGFAGVKKDGKWGFVDKSGKIVVPIQYDDAFCNDVGITWVKKDGKWGVINKGGKIVVPIQYDQHRLIINTLNEGFECVEKDGKWGVINTDGEIVIPIQFDFVDNFQEGLWSVWKGGKYGVVDRSGKVMVPIQYDYVQDFHEGFAGVKKDGKWGFVDKSGKVVVPIQYDDVHDFHEGFARIKKEGKLGFVDNSGKVVAPIQFDHATDFHEGFARVKKDGKCYVVDKSGKAVASIQYDECFDFYAALARVKKDGKWGFVDNKGIVVPILYDNCEGFHDGFAGVKKDGKWGFVDKSGKVVVPIQYDYVCNFYEGLAEVKKDGKRGLVDKSGRIVVPIQYDYIYGFHEGLAKAEKNGKWGLINKEGKIVVPIQYDDVGDFHEGLAVVRAYAFYLEGYVDRYGNTTLRMPLYNDTLQYAVNDYNALLKQYPYNYNENRIAYSLSLELPNDEKFLHDTLHSLLEIINRKKAQLIERYQKDSLQFKQLNDSLRKKIKESNEQLLSNPYNLQKRTIDDGLSDSLFGRTEELTEELHHKMSAIPKWQKQIEQEVYEDAKKNNPQRFCEIYFAQNPVQKQIADSIYVECRCKFPGRNAFDISFIDNTLSDCDCRDKQYQEVSYLYHSREEFDMSYNKEENAFFQEVEGRKKEKRILMQLEETLATQKQLKMKKALTSSKQEIIDIVNRVSQHRNGYYYEDAVELLLKYDDKMSKEWEKNGAYFKSKAEMYEYYIGEDYEKALKAKRRE